MSADSGAQEPNAAAANTSPTGDARVDAVIAGLDDLEGVPVEEHVEHYAQVHARLQDILNDVDSPASAD